jgi:diguanylate cyclase (GGDEF)-like protein/PAS domain S-box-containing protein
MMEDELGQGIDGPEGADLAVSASESHLHAIFDHAAIGIAVVDMDGHAVRTNPALERILGYSAAELAQMVFTDFTHPDDVAADWTLFQALIAGERDDYQIEKRYYRKHGELIWGQLTVSLIRDAQGHPTQAVGMITDITERKRAEESLAEAGVRYRTLVEQVPAVTYMWDFHGGIDDPSVSYVSPQIQEILGFSPEAFMARAELWFERVHPEDREAVVAETARSVESGEAFQMTYRMLARDGRIVWVRDEASAILQEDSGKVLVHQGILVDISELKRMEHELQETARVMREGQERLATIFRAAPIPIIIMSQVSGRVLELNDRWVEETGYSRQDLAAISFETPGTWLSEVDRATLNRTLASRGSVRGYETVLHTKNGESRPVLLSVEPIQYGDEPAQLSMVLDITDRKRAEAEVERHRQEFAKLSITDDLTGLLNRRGFYLIAEHQAAVAERERKALSLLFVDMDGLKDINDALGHDQGSRALTEVAQIMEATFRDSDVVARVGGDEFCILLSSGIPPEAGDASIKRLETAIDERNEKGDLPFVLSLSVGQSAYVPPGQVSLPALVRDADARMYEAKEIARKKRRRFVRSKAS